MKHRAQVRSSTSVTIVLDPEEDGVKPIFVKRKVKTIKVQPTRLMIQVYSRESISPIHPDLYETELGVLIEGIAFKANGQMSNYNNREHYGTRRNPLPMWAYERLIQLDVPDHVQRVVSSLHREGKL